MGSAASQEEGQTSGHGLEAEREHREVLVKGGCQVRGLGAPVPTAAW